MASVLDPEHATALPQERQPRGAPLPPSTEAASSWQGDGSRTYLAGEPTWYTEPIRRAWHRLFAPLHAGLMRAYHWFVQHTFIPIGLPVRWQQRGFGYVAAVLAAIVATTTMQGVERLLPMFAFPDALSFLIIALVALTWGAGPSIVATFLSGLLIKILIIPFRPGRFFSWRSLAELAVFFAVGIATSIIASQTERARRHAEQVSHSLEQEREQTRAIHAQSIRRLDDFMGTASHELRTPLAVIKGNAQNAIRRLQAIIEQHADRDPNLHEQLASLVAMLQRSDRQVARINRLVADLVDVSRIEANRLLLEVELCDLIQIARDTVEELRLIMPERRILYDIGNLATIPLRADVHRVSQVIYNLLTNALKYSGEDQPVVVTVQLDQADNSQMALVSVRDHGIGLALSEQQHIWDRFAHNEGTRVVSGSRIGLGIGLYISRTIIEAHHGNYGLTSTKDVGSLFWFALPFAEP